MLAPPCWACADSAEAVLILDRSVLFLSHSAALHSGFRFRGQGSGGDPTTTNDQMQATVQCSKGGRGRRHQKPSEQSWLRRYWPVRAAGSKQPLAVHPSNCPATDDPHIWLGIWPCPCPNRQNPPAGTQNIRKSTMVGQRSACICMRRFCCCCARKARRRRSSMCQM